MSQYRYKIMLERSPGADGLVRGEADDRLAFQVDNHDDVFRIIAAQRSKGRWSDDEAASLGLGLKLFSEVALLNRKDPLFEPLMPYLAEFIGRLKALPSAADLPRI